jgi:hypothetical protein
MRVRNVCSAVLAFLVASISCGAQQSTLTVDDVLARIREHIAEYKTSVPSFVSDESVLSQRFVSGKLKDQGKLESSFELKRKDDSGDLNETRTVKLVDGRPLKKDHGFSIPFTLIG